MELLKTQLLYRNPSQSFFKLICFCVWAGFGDDNCQPSRNLIRSTEHHLSTETTFLKRLL